MYYAGSDLAKIKDEQEKTCFCNVCKLSFKNEQHYVIHCNGLLHSERLSALHAKAEQNVSAAIAPSPAVQKSVRVDGYSSYKEPPITNSRLLKTTPAVATGREPYSSYDTSYAASNFPTEANAGWTSSEAYSSSDERGRVRSTSVTGLAARNVGGGWDSLSTGNNGSGRSQSLTRAAAINYDDQGYNAVTELLPESSGTRHARTSSLVPEKKSFSSGSGLDSGYASITDKYGTTGAYGYSAGHSLDTDYYGTTADPNADDWDNTQVAGVEFAGHGYGSAPALASESYGYDYTENYSSGDHYSSIPTGIAPVNTGFKSAGKLVSEKQGFSSGRLSSNQQAFNSDVHSDQTSYTSASGFSSGNRANVSAKNTAYSSGPKVVPGSQKHSSAQDSSADHWDYGYATEQSSDAYNYTSETADDYGYQGSANKAAYNWNQEMSKADYAETDVYSTEYDTAPQVFDYGHQDCPTAAVDSWGDSSEYYDDTQRGTNLWSKKSDVKQTSSSFKGVGSTGYPSGSGDIGRTSQAKFHRSGARTDYDVNYDPYSSDRNAPAASVQAGNRFAQASSDKGWNNEKSSGSRISSSDSKRAGRTSRWQDAEPSSDTAYWNSVSSNSAGAFNKSVNVPSTISSGVKSLMDNYSGTRHGLDSSYSSSTSHRSSDQREAARAGNYGTGNKSNSSDNSRPLLDSYSGTRRGSEPSFSSATAQLGKNSGKPQQGDGLVRYPGLLSQTMLSTTRSSDSSVTSLTSSSYGSSKSLLGSGAMNTQKPLSGGFDSSNKSTANSRDSSVRSSSSSAGFRTPAPVSAGNTSFASKSFGRSPPSSSGSEFKTPGSVRMSNVQTSVNRTPPNIPQSSPGTLGFRTPSPASTSRSPLLQSSSITSSSPGSRFQSSAAAGQVKVTSSGSNVSASRLSSPAASTTSAPMFKSTSPVITPLKGVISTVSPVRTGLAPASANSWSARQSSPVNTITPSGLVRSPVGSTGNVRTSLASSTMVTTPTTATPVSFASARQTSPAIGTTSSSISRSPGLNSTVNVRAPVVSTSAFSSGLVRQSNPSASATSLPLLRTPGVVSTTASIRTPIGTSSSDVKSTGAITAGSSASSRQPSPLLRSPGVSSPNVRSPAVASDTTARTTVPSLMSAGSARLSSPTVTAGVSPLLRTPVGVSSAASAVRSSVAQSISVVRTTVSSSVSGFRTPGPLTSSTSPSVRPAGVSSVVTTVSTVSTMSSPQSGGVFATRISSPLATSAGSVRPPISGVSVRPSGATSVSTTIISGDSKPSLQSNVVSNAMSSSVRAPGVSPSTAIRAANVTLSPSVRTPGVSPSTVRTPGVAVTATVRAPGNSVTPVRSSVVSSSTVSTQSPAVTSITAGKSNTVIVTCASSVTGSPCVSSTQSQVLTSSIATPLSRGAGGQLSPAPLLRPPGGVSVVASRTPGAASLVSTAGVVPAATSAGSARQQSPVVATSSSALLRTPVGAVRAAAVSTSTVRTPVPRLVSPGSTRPSSSAVVTNVSSPRVAVTSVRTPAALLTTPLSAPSSVSSSVPGPRTPSPANIRTSSPAVRPSVTPPSTLPAWRTPRPVGVTAPATGVRSSTPGVVASSSSGAKPVTVSSAVSTVAAKPTAAVIAPSTSAIVGEGKTPTSGSAVISSAATTSKSGSLALTSTPESQTSTAPNVKEVQQQPGSNLGAQQKDAPQEDSSDQNTKGSVTTAGLAGNGVSTNVVTSNEDVNIASKTTPPTVVDPAKDDMLARLLTLKPKDLLQEIVSGRVPVNLIDRVKSRLPAEMLQQAVDYLTNTDKAKQGTQKSDDSDKSSDKAVSTSADVTGGDSKAVSLKRKLEGFDASKLKDMKFDEVLDLFRQTVQDVLGGIFKADAKCVAKDDLAALRTLSAEDRSLVIDLQKTCNTKDLSKVVDTLRLLRSLDTGTVEALGRIDLAIVKKVMAGNAPAVQHGGTALRRLANHVISNKKPMLKVSAAEVSKPASTPTTRQQQPAVATKRPAASVPSLFNVGMPRGQSLQEKKQRLEVPSLISQTVSRPSFSGYQAQSRPTLLPNPRGVRPTSDSSWRQPATFGNQQAPRFRPTGPRGFGRGPTGY